MGLLLTAAAFGAGYTLGRPDGRAQLQNFLRQARELADRPGTRRLRESGRDIAGRQLTAARHRITARTSTAPTADGSTGGPAPAPAGMRRPRPAPLDTGTPGRMADGPAAAARVAEAATGDTTGPPREGPTAGFGGATVTEDSRAALLGKPTLPRPGTADPSPAGP